MHRFGVEVCLRRNNQPHRKRLRRDGTHGEEETSQTRMVCQVCASLFGLWILLGGVQSAHQPTLLEIPCFPPQHSKPHFVHPIGLLTSMHEASRITRECHPQAFARITLIVSPLQLHQEPFHCLVNGDANASPQKHQPLTVCTSSMSSRRRRQLLAHEAHKLQPKLMQPSTRTKRKSYAMV